MGFKRKPTDGMENKALKSRFRQEGKSRTRTEHIQNFLRGFAIMIVEQRARWSKTVAKSGKDRSDICAHRGQKEPQPFLRKLFMCSDQRDRQAYLGMPVM